MRYELHDEMGHGAFGTVFKGTDELGREFAIKQIKELRMKTHEVREILLSRTLNHPNIVHVSDVYTENDKLHLVMPIAMGSLDSFAYPPKLYFKLFVDCLCGIAYLHKMGIVHNDIKPPNILVFNEGENYVAKLSDLGLVYQCTDTCISNEYTGGTRYYHTDASNANEPHSVEFEDIYALAKSFLELHIQGDDDDKSLSVKALAEKLIQTPTSEPISINDVLQNIDATGKCPLIKSEINIQYPFLSGVVKEIRSRVIDTYIASTDCCDHLFTPEMWIMAISIYDLVVSKHPKLADDPDIIYACWAIAGNVLIEAQGASKKIMDDQLRVLNMIDWNVAYPNLRARCLHTQSKIMDPAIVQKIKDMEENPAEISIYRRCRSAIDA